MQGAQPLVAHSFEHGAELGRILVEDIDFGDENLQPRLIHCGGTELFLL